MPDAGPVDGVPGGEVVSAVKHQVRLRHEVIKEGIVRSLRHRDDFDIRIQGGDCLHHRRRLEFANARHRVGNLALQVGGIDTVIVNHRDAANASAAKIKRHRRAQSARANDQYVGGKELFLAFNAYFVEQDMP